MNEEKMEVEMDMDMDISAAAKRIMELVNSPDKPNEEVIEDLRYIGTKFGMTDEEIFDTDIPGDLFSKENRLPK